VLNPAPGKVPRRNINRKSKNEDNPFKRHQRLIIAKVADLIRSKIPSYHFNYQTRHNAS
jgi:hypothetical protein